MDCMEGMGQFPDNYFDLAIVDPPYGDGDNKALQTLGTNRTKYSISTFVKPDKKYFNELNRVSQNQVIWGGNYFTDYLKFSRCWLEWDKLQDLEQFADFELAWTSFDKVSKKFTKVSKGGFLTNNTINHKIHPTQKPVELYRWILINYGQAGWKILDTHVGSGSSLIACEREGFQYVGFEIDPDYYKAAMERIKRERMQLTLALQ